MVVLFSLAGLCEVCTFGQVTAFTPLHLPDLQIEQSQVAFWVGAITSVSAVVGLPFLPFWGALADRYGRKPLIIRSFVTAFVALALAAVAPNVWIFALARSVQTLGLGNTGRRLRAGTGRLRRGTLRVAAVPARPPVAVPRRLARPLCRCRRMGRPGHGAGPAGERQPARIAAAAGRSVGPVEHSAADGVFVEAL